MSAPDSVVPSEPDDYDVLWPRAIEMWSFKRGEFSEVVVPEARLATAEVELAEARAAIARVEALCLDLDGPGIDGKPSLVGRALARSIRTALRPQSDPEETQ